MRANHVFCATVFLLVLLPLGSSLLCYTCSSILGDKSCEEDFEPDEVEKVECEDDNELCMIHITPEVGYYPEVYHRGCIDKFFCSNLDEFSDHCIICDEDLCNSSSEMMSSILNTIVSIFVTTFILR